MLAISIIQLIVSTIILIFAVKLIHTTNRHKRIGATMDIINSSNSRNNQKSFSSFIVNYKHRYGDDELDQYIIPTKKQIEEREKSETQEMEESYGIIREDGEIEYRKDIRKNLMIAETNIIIPYLEDIELLAIGEHSGIYDFDVIYEYYDSILPRDLHFLELYIKDKRTNNPTAWIWFERLAKDFIKRNELKEA